MKMQQRNGEIELLRFVFAMIIMIFHFNLKFKLNMFYMGKMGVEFFFMVTGFLLAKSAKKLTIEKKHIPNCTWRFVLNRIASFLPYYIMTLILHIFFLLVLVRHTNINVLIKKFILATPRFLFFDCFGFRTDNFLVLGRDWYLSVMISVIFILFPLLLYNYECTSKIICPLVSVCGLGIVYKMYGTACPTGGLVVGVIDPCLIRGACNISLGVLGYELTLSIDKIDVTKLSRFLFSILKYISFILAILYMYGDYEKEYTVLPIVLLFLGIVLCFSNITYSIPYNKITALLGKISLPLFLTHGVFRSICGDIWPKNIEIWKVWIVMLFCPVFSYVFMIFTDFVWKKIKKTKKYFFNG